MNEIILAPCDVISKIKQHSSDMNEIILAPCDAGYVQSCTGFNPSPPCVPTYIHARGVGGDFFDPPPHVL
jgi:hypothetical protein